MVGRRSRDRLHAARLGCGTVLTYEAASLVPEVGEEVPCPRHGYCAVAMRERIDRRPSGLSPVPPRRSTRELADFLAPGSVTTLSVLRSNRFTLRIVVAAQKEGLVDVDLISGRVASLSGVSKAAATGEGARRSG
jgi:hypothetical protein